MARQDHRCWPIHRVVVVMRRSVVVVLVVHVVDAMVGMRNVVMDHAEGRLHSCRMGVVDVYIVGHTVEDTHNHDDRDAAVAVVVVVDAVVVVMVVVLSSSQLVALMLCVPVLVHLSVPLHVDTQAYSTVHVVLLVHTHNWHTVGNTVVDTVLWWDARQMWCVGMMRDQTVPPDSDCV